MFYTAMVDNLTDFFSTFGNGGDGHGASSRSSRQENVPAGAGGGTCVGLTILLVLVVLFVISMYFFRRWYRRRNLAKENGTGSNPHEFQPVVIV